MTLSHEEIMRILFAARLRLSAVAWIVVRDAQAAEDLFQDAALKALTKNVVFEHEGALLSWATVSIRRGAIDWVRRRRPEQPGLDPGVLDLLDAESRSSAVADSGRVGALRDCLDAMPGPARRLLELRYFEGHTCGEVARRAGLELDAVYQRLSRLHRQLRACIEQRLSAGAEAASP